MRFARNYYSGESMKNKKFAWLEKVDEHEWKFDFSMDKWNSDEDLDIAIQEMEDI